MKLKYGCDISFYHWSGLYNKIMTDNLKMEIKKIVYTKIHLKYVEGTETSLQMRMMHKPVLTSYDAYRSIAPHSQ